jgi:hypothetical protein
MREQVKWILSMVASIACRPRDDDVPAARSNGDLRADLDGAARRNVKISTGIIRRPGKKNKKSVLPARHFGLRRRPQTSPGQKKRCAHHVEFEAVAAAGREPEQYESGAQNIGIL